MEQTDDPFTAVYVNVIMTEKNHIDSNMHMSAFAHTHTHTILHHY